MNRLHHHTWRASQQSVSGRVPSLTVLDDPQDDGEGMGVSSDHKSGKPSVVRRILTKSLFLLVFVTVLLIGAQAASIGFGLPWLDVRSGLEHLLTLIRNTRG